MNWWMVLIMWSSVLVMCLQMNLTAILCGHPESSDGLVCLIYTPESSDGFLHSVYQQNLLIARQVRNSSSFTKDPLAHILRERKTLACGYAMWMQH